MIHDSMSGRHFALFPVPLEAISETGTRAVAWEEGEQA